MNWFQRMMIAIIFPTKGLMRERFKVLLFDLELIKLAEQKEEITAKEEIIIGKKIWPEDYA
tara:strand:- start:125 stop:307 length:183 start_codon:yes stop_codon:yes gene_type:complete